MLRIGRGLADAPTHAFFASPVETLLNALVSRRSADEDGLGVASMAQSARAPHDKNLEARRGVAASPAVRVGAAAGCRQGRNDYDFCAQFRLCRGVPDLRRLRDTRRTGDLALGGNQGGDPSLPRIRGRGRALSQHPASVPCGGCASNPNHLLRRHRPLAALAIDGKAQRFYPADGQPCGPNRVASSRRFEVCRRLRCHTEYPLADNRGGPGQRAPHSDGVQTRRGRMEAMSRLDVLRTS
jgi:hypothetical protein